MKMILILNYTGKVYYILYLPTYHSKHEYINTLYYDTINNFK